MPILNFTLQDIIGTGLAFLLFPIVMVFPGYVTAWTFDLFEFKQRRSLTQFIIAIVVSLSISPILIYLLYKLVSASFTLIILFVFAIFFGAIVICQWVKRKPNWDHLKKLGRYPSLAIFIATIWVIFTIFSLVDLQLNKKLYHSVVSYDFATRVAVISALTRTGVPPINPSYFPGHSEHLTFLYYFWYALCSIIDQLGGNMVDANMAMIASVAWCGLGLMATIALYLRLRNPIGGTKAWRSALIGIGLLVISGLDAIPVTISMIASRLTQGFMWPFGDIEHWNEQITAWVGSIFWVPHHVASMIACLTGIMLLQSVRRKNLTRQIVAMMIAGMGFASAVGLSTWVTAVFVIFWVIWMVTILLKEKEWKLIVAMLLAGIIALMAASPFLIAIFLGASGAASNGLPFAVEVRQLEPLAIDSMASLPKNIVYFLLLPANYLFELGFFFTCGLLWLHGHRKFRELDNPFYVSEIILFCVVLIIGSFVRSTIINNNDLGWRCWLFGQFVLLIWATDIIEQFLARHNLKSYFTSDPPTEMKKVGRFLVILATIGAFTSIMNVALLRTWTLLVDHAVAGFPNGISPDTNLGSRTFAARQAYNYIRDDLPKNIIIQHNPQNGIDRPSGLYGTRQMVISLNTAYGIPHEQYDFFVKQISPIFLSKNITNWDEIDRICNQYFINIIIVNDLDPLWSSLSALEQKRSPLYQNQYYAVLGCGNFAHNPSH